MSHEVEEMFSVHKPTWHGLGTILDDYPDWEQAPILAGHDFEVIEQPVFVKLERTIEVPTQYTGDDGEIVHGVMLEDATTYPQLGKFKAVTNSKNGVVFAVTNESYEVIQNTVGWELAEALVENTENVKVETAGTLKQGALCWALLRVDEPYTIDGDPDNPIFPFVTVSWAHDGSAALRCFPTDVRIVCFNTHSAASAKADRYDNAYVFRHTKNVAARIEDAKAVMAGQRASSAQFRELANELVTIPVTVEQREEFIKLFIPEPDTTNVISDRVLDNINTARAKVRGIFDSPTIPENHALTAYGLVEAGVEYLDHLRAAKSAETKFARTLLRPEPLKARLVPMVRELLSA